MNFNIEKIQINRLTLYVKENWDYLECLEFQKDLISEVQKNPQQRFMVICSHPHLFTHGRGLQKAKKGQELSLKDFDDSQNLPFKLHQIARGGGLTFHYPGQFIVYPILKLDSQNFTMKKVIYGMMDLVKNVCSELYQINNLDYHRDLLGLWSGEKKLASIGMATERYITYHGMALNLQFDKKMLDALVNLSPCGISPLQYIDLQSLIKSNSSLKRSDFQEAFLRQLETSFWSQ